MLAICLPVKSIAKAVVNLRLPVMTVLRVGLITDERYIAGFVELESVQYRILHSAQYDFVS